MMPLNKAFLRYIPKAFLQQPFELFFGILCVIAGVQHLTQALPTDPLEILLPKLIVTVWNFSLAFGGALVVLGIFRNAMYVERAGLSLLGPASIVYSIILIAYVGMRAYLSIIILAVFGIACFIKDFTIKIATISINKLFPEKSSGG